jgi:transcriptional regulator with XRE-family HTH domain
MSNREHRLERAEYMMSRDAMQAGQELRQARRNAGLTIRSVAAAAGIGRTTVQRGERGVLPGHRNLARHAAAVGLRARIKLYPGGDVLRDAGQISLIRRFRERVGDVGHWAFEVPIPSPYDQRALDAVLTLPSGKVGFEFYTRLADAQAQLRSAHTKKRDAGLDRMVIVVAATHANRRALGEAAPAMVELFPASTRRLLAALTGGDAPSTDGVILF